MRLFYSPSELSSFACFLRFDFLKGFDILQYTLTDLNLLYIVVSENLDSNSARRILSPDRLVHALNFYNEYGKAVGMRTLYEFVETYYRCSISAIGLARNPFSPWSTRAHCPHNSSRSVEAMNTLMHPDSQYSPSNQSVTVCSQQFGLHQPDSDSEDIDCGVKCMFHRPLFEIASLRKWAIESISREGINFRMFEALVLASYWFRDRQEIIAYLSSNFQHPDGVTAVKYVRAYTSKDVWTEMDSGCIWTSRFADAFPDILALALIRCNASLTGKQLARYVFMCAIDLDGDAKRINTESVMGLCKRRKGHKRKLLFHRKIKYLSERWCPRIKLITHDRVEWKGSYTVAMLEEYICMIRQTEGVMPEQSFYTHASKLV